MTCRWLWCLGRGPPSALMPSTNMCWSYQVASRAVGRESDDEATRPPREASEDLTSNKLCRKVPVEDTTPGVIRAFDAKDSHATLKAGCSKQHRPILDSPAAYHDNDLENVFQQAQRQLQAAAIADAATAPSTVPELRLLQQKLKVAVSAGVLGLPQAAQHLHAIRQWLHTSSSCSVSAADSLLKCLQETLQQMEGLLLQAEAAGQWITDYVDASLALLQLYADLTQQATNPRPHAKPLRAALAQLLLARPQPISLAASMLSYMLQDCSSREQTSEPTTQVPSAEVLLWNVLLALFKFASLLGPSLPTQLEHADHRTKPPNSTLPDASAHGVTGGSTGCTPPPAVQKQAVMGDVAVDVCSWVLEVQRLAQQPDGALAMMLSRPFNMRHAAGQLAALQALRQLYALQQMQLMQQDIAGSYAAMHYHSLLQYYHAAGRDTQCAAAKLCAVHLDLLEAAVATGSVTARLALQRAGAVDWLLDQFALESQLYSEEQARAAEEDAAAGSETDSDAESELGQMVAGRPGTRVSPTRYSRNSHMQHGGKPEKFVFTYDLNEDVERLMALEEKTGQSVELDGLEYDDEAKQLMARSPVLVPLPPLTPMEGTGTPRAPHTLPPLRLNQSPSHMLANRLLSNTRAPGMIEPPSPPHAAVFSDSGLLMEPHKPSVPRLALGSLRSAASSRIATPLRMTPPDGTGVIQQAASPSRYKGSLSLRSRASKSGAPGTLKSHQSEQPADQQPASAPRLLQGPLSSRSTGASGDVMLSPGPLTSSRLHHSHLSPLSTRSSNPPAGPTHVFNILPSQQPLSSSRGAASSHRSARVEATTTGSTLQAAAGHEQPQREPAAHSLMREVTCALPDAPAPQQASNEAAGRMNSETWDAVPDLQPRPPVLPHPGAAAVQGQGHRGLSPGNKPVPTLNLLSISHSHNTSSDRSGRVTDSQRGAVSSQRSTLATHSTMADSAMNPHHLVPSTASTSPAAPNPFAHQSVLAGEEGIGGRAALVQPSYAEAVQALLWFHDPQLHAHLLHLLLSLLVKPSGALECNYIQAFPADAGSTNVEHQLTWHLAGPAAGAVLPHLVQLLQPATQAAQHDHAQHRAACLRLLRLLARQLLACDRYTDLVFHSRGAYGAVYRAKLQDHETGSVEHVMVKAIELPGSGFDRCVLPDVYGEVSILERYALHLFPPAIANPGSGNSYAPCSMPNRAASLVGSGSSTARQQACMGICQLHDYGLAQSAYWLVMRRYRCTLAEWRARQPSQQGPAATAMYLAVLQQVIESMELLAADAIVHFDLKASNVLVYPLEGVKDSQLYGPAPPPPCLPAFRPVLADFGEARAYGNSDEAFTARNRGTEMYKSPEMLLMHSALRPSNPGNTALPASNQPANAIVGVPGSQGAAAASPIAYGQQSQSTPATGAAHNGAGLASDVWSFGLLAYELLSGRMLFSEADYASVTHRVAFGAGVALTLSESEVAALGTYGTTQLKHLVEWILMRDPAHRPSLRSIHDRLAQIRAHMLQQVATASNA